MSGVPEVLETLFKTHVVPAANLPGIGRDVKIKKANLRTMKSVTDFLGKVIEDLAITEDDLPSLNVKDPAVILKLISTHYDPVIDLAVQFSDLEKEALLEADLDESVLVIQAIVLLNRDFFTKKVLPILKSLDQGT